MALICKRVSPVLPVRHVARALAAYRKLGFEADAYSEVVSASLRTSMATGTCFASARL